MSNETEKNISSITDSALGAVAKSNAPIFSKAASGFRIGDALAQVNAGMKRTQAPQFGNLDGMNIEKPSDVKTSAKSQEQEKERSR